MHNVAEGMPHIGEKRTQRLHAFAQYVSVLPWFTIDVLHKLYLNVFQIHEKESSDYKERSITCADLIHSHSVTRISYNVFAMNPLVRDALRNALREKGGALNEIATFMLAYIESCRSQCPGPRYVEAYRIEGNLVLNPLAEASRLTGHIVHDLNQIPDFGQKKNTVSYYLNILNQHSLSEEHQELKKFLKGYQNYKTSSSELPEEWKDLTLANTSNAETIRIKLPPAIRDAIVREIRETTRVLVLHTLIVGINQYASTDIDTLTMAVASAEKFENLISTYRVSGLEYRTNKLIDREATREAVLREVRSIGSKMHKGDTFVLYFSGHGGHETRWIDPIQNMPVKGLQKTMPVHDPSEDFFVLACHDSGGDVPYLAVSEIEYLLSEFPRGSNCILILDAGHQGAFSASARLPHQFEWGEQEASDWQYDGAILGAAQKGHDAYEDPEHGRHFTYGLLAALARHQNQVSYARLFTGADSIHMPDFNTQAPFFETKGSFSAETPFLNGFLRPLNEEAIRRIVEAFENNATELDLSHLQLEHIPAKVFELSALKTLDISHNQIVKIPEDISRLTSLEVLVAHNNPIADVRDEIGDLLHLRAVILYQCALTTFPHALTRLKQLENLQLEGNQIKWVPMTILKMPVLAQLDVRDNPVLNLPADLLQCAVTQLIDFFVHTTTQVPGGMPVALVVGLDYEDMLRNIHPEIDTVHQILSSAGMEVVTLINPDSVSLFKELYRHQDDMQIMHIAAFHLNSLLKTGGDHTSLDTEEFAEMFRCARAGRYPTRLLVLNCCETKPLVDLLLSDCFDAAIGMEGVVDDEMAYAFARDFYTALAERIPVGQAFESLRDQTQMMA